MEPRLRHAMHWRVSNVSVCTVYTRVVYFYYVSRFCRILFFFQCLYFMSLEDSYAHGDTDGLAMLSFCLSVHVSVTRCYCVTKCSAAAEKGNRARAVGRKPGGLLCPIPWGQLGPI